MSIDYPCSSRTGKKSPYSLIATITLNISRINKTLTTFLPYTVKTPDPMNMKGRVDLDQS